MATAAKDVQGRKGERRRVLMRGTVFSLTVLMSSGFATSPTMAR